MYNTTDYCLDKEIWKDIPGYEKIYQASNYGRIRTVDGKKTFSTRHGTRIWKGVILKPRGINPKTGHRVSLWKEKKANDYLIARLICLTFKGEVENFYDYKNGKIKITVNHKDGNRFNNNLENLEWITLKENIQHAFNNGLMPHKRIMLIDSNGNETIHNSMAMASKYINRYSAYISAMLISKSVIKSKSGETFTAIKLKSC